MSAGQLRALDPLSQPPVADTARAPLAALQAAGSAWTALRPAPAAPPQTLAGVDRPDDGGNAVPVLALDLRRLGAAGLPLPGTGPSALGIEIQRLKRTLLLAFDRRDGDAGPRAGTLVLVTSAVGGEGKSFCAASLALSVAAEVDTSVLWVDAQVDRPDGPERPGGFGLPASAPGLLDLLAQPSRPLASTIVRTDIAGLSVLPRGVDDGSPLAERFASGAMGRLLDELAAQDARRLVLIDGPPLLGSTAAASMARHVGQVVLVVAQGRTPRRAVVDALAMLARCPVVVPVLNFGSVAAAGRA